MTHDITVDMLDAIKVKWIKSIFEDDFPERGMICWLTGIDWVDNTKCYKLHFDFSEFEAVNQKYYREEYYENKYTEATGLAKPLYTALEAGMYTPKYWVYFNCDNMITRDDTKFAHEIKQYLQVVG